MRTRINTLTRKHHLVNSAGASARMSVLTQLNFDERQRRRRRRTASINRPVLVVQNRAVAAIPKPGAHHHHHTNTHTHRGPSWKLVLRAHDVSSSSSSAAVRNLTQQPAVSANARAHTRAHTHVRCRSNATPRCARPALEIHTSASRVIVIRALARSRDVVAVDDDREKCRTTMQSYVCMRKTSYTYARRTWCV